MPLKDSDLKVGDRVRTIKWGKLTEGEYVGLEGTVTVIHNDIVRVKLDKDPVAKAMDCPFWPSELQIIKEKVGATN